MGTASSPAAMQLAGLIFALDMHAAELTTPDDDDDDGGDGDGGVRGGRGSHGGGGRDGNGNRSTDDDARDNNNTNELKRWAVGDCVLHFRKDRRRHVLVVVSSAVAMGDDVPAQLAEAILRGFVAKHGKHLDAPGGPPPGKTLKFTSELYKAGTG